MVRVEHKISSLFIQNWRNCISPSSDSLRASKFKRQTKARSKKLSISNFNEESFKADQDDSGKTYIPTYLESLYLAKNTATVLMTFLTLTNTPIIANIMK